MPAFQLLLTSDRLVHRRELLEPYEPVNSVLCRETLHLPAPVLVEARDQVGSHADVDRPVFPAGKNVDARLPHGCIACEGMDAETSSA